VGQRDPKGSSRNDQSERAREDQNQQPAGRAAVLILGSVLFLVQVGLIAGVLPAGGATEAGKSDWWPCKQYSYTDVILAIATSAYLLATIAYVLISFHQWRVLRAALDETRRSNELTLRAWLFVESIELEGGVLTDDASIAVTVKNYGKLPAIRVARYPKIYVQPNTPVPEVPDGEAAGWRVIAAGATHTFRFGFDDVPPEQIPGIAQGQPPLFFVLRLRYTDDLNSQGNQPYSWFYSPPTRGFRELPSRDSLD
jgi:hypothetical protein